VEILGQKLLKVPAVMSDNAAKDVGDKIFVKKAEEMVALLRNHEDAFTIEELEIMSTNFVDNCITHGGGLASKRHYNSMALYFLTQQHCCRCLWQRVSFGEMCPAT
jgi:hypothetical protein